MIKLQRLAENVFVVISLLFFSGAVLGLVSPTKDLHQTILFGNYGIQAIAILLIVVRWKRVVRIVIREKLLWALVGLAVTSVFWSDEPMLTLYRTDGPCVIALVLATLFGVYLATRYSLNEQLWLLAWTLGTAALLSLVVSLVLPQYGVMGMGVVLSSEDLSHPGAWRGIYGHKTILGTIMALSTLVFLFFATNSRRYRWVAWAGIGLSVGILVLSTTKGALVILLTIVFLLPFYGALRWNYSLAVPFFITTLLVTGGVATLFLGNADTILGSLGRDTTFSGRTSIWPAVLDKIWERPWLGYGYGVFWRGWEGESADVWRTSPIQAAHAHDGFLDLSLDLGFLGLSVFALSFLTVCLRAVKWIRLTKTAEGLVPLSYLTFMVMYNLTESALVRADLIWVLYVAVTLSMHNESSISSKLK